MPATDWVAVAEGLKLDIPREDVEAIAPLLDGLLDSFRPLAAQLDLVRTEGQDAE